MGTPRAAGPGGRLRPPVARRAVPGRRGGMGPASPHGPTRAHRGDGGTDARGTAWLVHAVAGHAPGHRVPARTWAGCWPRCGRGREPDRAHRRGLGRLLAVLRARGACFRSELPGASGRLDADVDEGLWDLVARGHRHRRRLLRRAAPALRPGPAAAAPGRRAARRAALAASGHAVGSGIGEGRWSLLPDAEVPDRDRSGPRPRRWPRPWPGSCWPAGASWPGSSGTGSPTGSPGGTWCGPSGGWRPGARPWADGSSPGSPASSTPPPSGRAARPGAR